jgi:divalent metal cation (Fe/Co/Zn/Cd) transporter
MRGVSEPDDDGERVALVRTAVRVSWFSVVWSIVVGVAALVSGFAAGSLALIGFGLDSVIDSSASVVLVWRFRVEGLRPHHAERVERVAARAVGITLIVIALYIVAGSAHSLATGSSPETSALGITLAAISVVVLPGVAVWKVRLAGRLSSRALRGDGMLTGAGAVLALVTLLAIVVDNTFGWWWSDAVAAILIAAFLASEGAQALRVDE